MTIKPITTDADAKKPLASQSPDIISTDDNKTNTCKNGLSNGEITPRKKKPKYQPDNRWSWVILVATFFNYVVVSAIWYSFSVLYREFADHFDMSLASIGVLASVEAAALHFTGNV
jgi:hypothetical protein